MLYQSNLPSKNLILISFLFFLFASCVNTKKATYFNDLQNIDLPELDIEPIIQNNDLLSITVSSLNPEASLVFNTPNQHTISTSNGMNAGTITTGYLVDHKGQIVFPILGYINAAGLTQSQLTQFLSNTLLEKKLLLDPIVSVRILNFKVTVIGEVSKPGVIMAPDGKISLLEALGNAGDLTIYAKRNNVLLIRVENGKKITRRIDLNSQDFVFNSPYYYLKTNDVVYVEPNKAKVTTASTLQQLLPIAFSALSVIIIVLDRFVKH